MKTKAKVKASETSEVAALREQVLRVRMENNKLRAKLARLNMAVKIAETLINDLEAIEGIEAEVSALIRADLKAQRP